MLLFSSMKIMKTVEELLTAKCDRDNIQEVAERLGKALPAVLLAVPVLAHSRGVRCTVTEEHQLE